MGVNYIGLEKIFFFFSNDFVVFLDDFVVVFDQRPKFPIQDGAIVLYCLPINASYRVTSLSSEN
jgi:hypothetical protein